MKKKKPIIHYLDYDGRYLCIKACGDANPQKVTKNILKLTCKNCRKILQLPKLGMAFIFR